MATMQHDTAIKTAFEGPMEVLKQEHRVIERGLRVLEALAETPGESSPEQWEQLIDFIRNFADGCHHLKEEKLLFPALEKSGMDPTAGPVAVLLEEHEEGRRYVRAMAEATATKDFRGSMATLAENAKSYLQLLWDHIQKEDEALFEMADEVLPREDQVRLVAEFEEHERREMGEGVHERYLALIEELEKSVQP